MSIDRELYRKAYETHHQWKLAERAGRAYNAGQRTPLECWRAYIIWWEFLMSIAPPISEAQQARRLADWAAYYERTQKFEAWRKEHGK